VHAPPPPLCSPRRHAITLCRQRAEHADLRLPPPVRVHANAKREREVSGSAAAGCRRAFAASFHQCRTSETTPACAAYHAAPPAASLHATITFASPSAPYYATRVIAATCVFCDERCRPWSCHATSLAPPLRRCSITSAPPSIAASPCIMNRARHYAADRCRYAPIVSVVLGD